MRRSVRICGERCREAGLLGAPFRGLSPLADPSQKPFCPLRAGPEAPPQRRGSPGRRGPAGPRGSRAKFRAACHCPDREAAGAASASPAPRESRGETRCPAPGTGPRMGVGVGSHLISTGLTPGQVLSPAFNCSVLRSVTSFLHRSFPPHSTPCPLPLSFVSLLLSVFFSHLFHLFLSIVVLPVSPALPFLSSFSLSPPPFFPFSFP